MDSSAGNSEEVSEQNRGTQARGVIEEEEIEEEESDLPRFEEDLDMGEFEELEEEVLGQSGEQMVPMGKELMEAVRDAHVNEQATGKYEAEGLDPDELEEVEEAFGQVEEEAEGGEEENGDTQRNGRRQRGKWRSSSGLPAAHGSQTARPSRRASWQRKAASDARKAAASVSAADAGHQRPAERRPGNSGPDCQRTHCQERRAHYQPHCAARTLSGLHAHGASHGRFAQDCFRRRTPSPEADCAERARRRAGRIHCPHSGSGRGRAGPAQRYSLPHQFVE